MNKLFLTLMLIICFSILILLQGCDQGGDTIVEETTISDSSGNGGGTSDTTRPTVSSTSPTSNATNVAINSTITVTFSETMDSSTVTTNTFTLSGGVTGTVTYSGTTAIFAPASNLAASTLYTATITTGVKDAAGNAIAVNYTWSFTTGTSADTTEPVITGVNTSSTTTSSTVINWTTDESSDSQVQYGTSTSYGNTTTLNASMVTIHSQTINSLSSATLYHYRVLSRDASSNLATSGDYTFSTSAAGNGTATLTWTAPTTNEDGSPLTELTGYKVNYGTSSGFYTTVKDDVGTATTYTVTGLDSGTYYFVVTAYNTNGESDFSNEVSKDIQ